jgi:hypothetical protein
VCRFLILFVFGLCLCSPTFSQEQPDSLFQVSERFSLALEQADLSQKQARILSQPYKDLIAGLELYVSQQKQTSEQAKDLLKASEEVKASLIGERQARESELLTWKLATGVSVAGLVVTLVWLAVESRK